MFDKRCLGVFHTETICRGGISPTKLAFWYLGTGGRIAAYLSVQGLPTGGPILAFCLLSRVGLEVFMNSISRAAHFFALSLFIAASGCESVALMPRPDVDQTDNRRPSSGRDLDQYGQDQYSRERETRPRGEIIGTVERIDEVRREISVRTNDQRNVVLKYDPRTVVFDRDREFSVVDLRNGDVVRIEPSRGDYVDVIRLIEASRS